MVVNHLGFNKAVPLQLRDITDISSSLQQRIANELIPTNNYKIDPEPLLEVADLTRYSPNTTSAFLT